MRQSIILKDMLAKDTFYCSLFYQAADVQEAIAVASLYGLSLSVKEVTAFRGNVPKQKALRTRFVEKLVARFPEGSPAPCFGDGTLGYGFSHFGGGCPDSHGGCHH